MEIQTKSWQSFAVFPQIMHAPEDDVNSLKHMGNS